MRRFFWLGLLFATLSAVRAAQPFSDGKWHSMGFIHSGVSAVLASGSDLFIGGTFSSVGGVPANGVARWNGTNWSALGAGVTGVRALAGNATNLFVGGYFESAGGVAALGVARWNGTTWQALGAGLNGGATVLALSGTNLFAGGHLSTAGGISASGIARWNGVSWSALGSGVSSFSQVTALAVLGTNLYVGGTFVSAGGLTVNRIAKWDGASWSPLGSGLDAPPTALNVIGNDLYVAGGFERAGGLAARHLAKWNGTAWSAFGDDSNDRPTAMTVVGNEIYVAAPYRPTPEILAYEVKRWNGVNWVSLGAVMNEAVSALAATGSTLYAAGDFESAGGRRAIGIAKYIANTWTNVGAGLDRVVMALGTAGTNLYVGGIYGSPGNVGRWNGTFWEAVAGQTANGPVFALSSNTNDLFVGGNFSKIGTNFASSIAKWNGLSWTNLRNGVNGEVRAVATGHGYLYAGGNFLNSIGVSARLNHIARWNGSVWASLGSGFNGPVSSLLVSGNDLYAAGAFSRATNAGGVVVVANNVAKWNGTAWSAMGLGLNGNAVALAKFGSDLVAGGYFTTAGGVSANYIAKWNGTSWSPLGTGMNGPVKTLAVNAYGLYAGGQFVTAGGAAATNFAHWDGDQWFPLGSGVNASVEALLTSGDSLIVGGEFTMAGAKRMVGLARASSRLGQSISLDRNRFVTPADFPLSLTATATSGLPVEFRVLSGPGTLSGNILTLTTGVALTNEVWVEIEANQPGNEEYEPAPKALQSVRIARQSQSISFTHPANVPFGVAPFALNVFANSGLPVTLIVTNGPAILNGNMITVTGVGRVYITASQPGNERFLPAVSVTRDFSVYKAPQTINFATLTNVTPADGPLSLSANASSGLPVAFRVVSGPAILDLATLSIIGEGVVTVEASQPGNDLYLAATPVQRSFSISRLTQVIAFSSLPNMNPADSPVALTASASSGLPVSYRVVSGPAVVDGASLEIAGEGTVTVEAFQTGDLRYGPAIPIRRTFTSAKLLQEISFSFLSDVNPADSPFLLTASASSGLAVTYRVVNGPATIYGATLQITGEGVIALEVSQPGDLRYRAANPITHYFTAAKTPQIITFPAITPKTFGIFPFPLGASANSGLPVTYELLNGPGTLNGDILTINGAGTVAVRASQPGNDRFAAATSVSRNVVIAPAPALVLLSAPDSIFDGNPKRATAETIPQGLPVLFFYNSNNQPPSEPGSYYVQAIVDHTNYHGSANRTMLIGFSLATEGVNSTVSRSPDLPLYENGAVVSLSAVGMSNLFFSRWAGDVPAGREMDNPISVPMTQNRRLTAHFIQNTGGPFSLSLAPNWLYDDVGTNTLIGKFAANDPDPEDAWRFALVPGEGSQDNGKFKIIRNELRTSDNPAQARFSYDTNRTHSIRVQVTDAAGLSFDTALRLQVVDSSPTAKFELKRAFTNSPSYVNAIFSLRDTNGVGINLPRELFDQTNDVFIVQEGIQEPVDRAESLLQVNKIEEVPARIRTVLLLDLSTSIEGNLQIVKAAASNLVEKIAPKQEIAIYTFAFTMTKVQDFTSDKAVLRQAVQNIFLPLSGRASTDLYGSVNTLLDAWNESYSLAGIETGFLVVFTDGRDSRRVLGEPEAALNLVSEKRDTAEKKIFTVGFPTINADPDRLRRLGNAGFWWVESFDQLSAIFLQVQENIYNDANSFYWLNYSSPQSGNLPAELIVSLNGNKYSGLGSTLNWQFYTHGFQPLNPSVFINRTVTQTAGIDSIQIPAGGSFDLRALTFGAINQELPPTYSWTVANSSLLSTQPIGTDGARARLISSGRNGTTTLTLEDTLNNPLVPDNFPPGISNIFLKTITVVVGAGIDTPHPSFKVEGFSAGSNGAFRVSFTGEVGRFYELLSSTNLVDWTRDQSHIATSTQVELTNSPPVPSSNVRFYKVRAN